MTARPRYVDETEILTLLDATTVLASQAEAFAMAPDHVDWVQDHRINAHGQLLFMHGASLPDGTAVYKTGVQRSPQVRASAAPVQASVTVHRPVDGVLTHVLDGATVTALRTAGGLLQCLSSVQPGPGGVLGVFGSGRQAQELCRLARELGFWSDILVWSPRLSRDGCRRWESGAEVTVDARDLCERSDVIATCTSSTDPVLQAAWLRPGATVGTMGSYMPDRCEIGLDVTAAASLTVIDSAGARESVGPVVAGLSAGVLTSEAIGSMADIVSQGESWQRPPGIVVVHCSGLGVQDATLASAVVSRLEQGAGE